MDARDWVALRQDLRRMAGSEGRSGTLNLRDLLGPALAAELLTTPLCEELLRTARVLRSEGEQGPAIALASALERAVSSLALDPRWASEAVLQRIVREDLRATSARARLHWLVERAGLGDAQGRALRALEHGPCDEHCARVHPSCVMGVRAAHAWHEPPLAAARALEEAVSNFLDGEWTRE